MKHLTDLTEYKGTLPYASELFGVYQPLLGWKSKRIKQRIEYFAQSRLNDLIGRLNMRLKPNLTFAGNRSEGASLTVATIDADPHFDGIVASHIKDQINKEKEVTPQLWDRLLHPDTLNDVLKKRVLPAFQLSTSAAEANTLRRDTLARSIGGQSMEAGMLRESRVAGMLSLLRENGQYNLLNSLFLADRAPVNALWSALGSVYDPFATIDPAHVLDRVGLSPVGLAHLFRQYFFEFDTFLGSPVGHIWVSPGSTVELTEVHTRRVLVEQTFEQSLESIRKSEKSLTLQDELSDAVKQDNRTDTKLGVNVSSNQSWGWGSANESASFDMANTQQKAREQTHKTMRQQSEKLSEEIKQNFKTTFRTVTETTDTSSKRYLLANSTNKLINYELRRKMRQVAVQVQDVGSYLCWQTYVDDPGKDLGVARLVHVGSPPDLSRIPAPEMIVPPAAFDEEVMITIPFIDADDASNDDTFDDGAETSLGLFDGTNHIVADIKQGPVRCSQANFKLTSVTVDTMGADAVITVDSGTIAAEAGTSGAFNFVTHLKHINFHSTDSMSVKAILHWEPQVDQTKINTENEKRLSSFTAKEEAAFRKSFLDAARERIKFASDIQPRRADDLREEERIVVYRALIHDMLAPAKHVPQPDAQSQHLVAELISSIFDVDKLLYFVAPEWWRPRLHHTHQDLGSIPTQPDPVTGKPIAVPNSVPQSDTVSWGEGATREDSYFITEDSKPARLGSSLGWLLQLDGDDLRNAFLNAPWVKAVMPIRPGKESAALNWLKHVEGMNGIDATDMYAGPEPDWNGKKTVFEVLGILAEQVRLKHEESVKTQKFIDPLDDSSTVSATPLDRVYEHGFDPLKGGFRANVDGKFEIFDQWIEVLPTDQVVAVEVTYDPKTGRQL